MESAWPGRFDGDVRAQVDRFGVLPISPTINLAAFEHVRNTQTGTVERIGRFPFSVSLFGYGSPIDPPAWEAWYFNLEPVRVLEARLREMDPGMVRYWNVDA